MTATPSDTHWFPMYVTYRREERIKHQLDDMGIENFLPMKPRTPANAGDTVQVPAIHNMIFVHATYDLICDLKTFRKEYAPMQFVTKPASDGNRNVVLTISDRQMQNFMFAYSLPPDRWFFMENCDSVSKDAKKVEFVEGECVGIRGVIKRVKGNRHVIVRLGDYASIAIKIQHISQLRNLDA